MSQQFLEIISQTFAAGETKIFQVSGQYFELLDAPFPVNVRLTDRSGAQRGLMTAAEASFFLRNSDFETIELVSPTAQTIRFMYGSAEAGTRRSAGVVSVVDGGKARSKTGLSFFAGFYHGAIAGNYSQVQLWNPAASGRNLVLTQINYSMAAIGGVFLRRHTGALVTNASSVILNKLISGAAGVAQFRTEAFTALFGTSFHYIHLLARSAQLLRVSDPIIVEQGNGVIVACDQLATEVAGAFEWTEEPN